MKFKFLALFAFILVFSIASIALTSAAIPTITQSISSPVDGSHHASIMVDYRMLPDPDVNLTGHLWYVCENISSGKTVDTACATGGDDNFTESGSYPTLITELNNSLEYPYYLVHTTWPFNISNYNSWSYIFLPGNYTFWFTSCGLNQTTGGNFTCFNSTNSSFEIYSLLSVAHEHVLSSSQANSNTFEFFANLTSYKSNLTYIQGCVWLNSETFCRHNVTTYFDIAGIYDINGSFYGGYDIDVTGSNDYNVALQICANNTYGEINCLWTNNVTATITTTSVLNSLTKSIFSLIIGFLALAILGFAIYGIGRHIKNNFAELDNKQFITYAVLLLLLVVVGIVIISYVSGQYGETFNDHLGTYSSMNIMSPGAIPPGPYP